MKKILLSLLSFLLLVSSNAQIGKGKKMIGGEFSFTSTDNDNYSFFGSSRIITVSIAPELGFGLGGNWIAGGGVGYGHQSQKVGTSDNYSKVVADVFSVTLFARKFFPLTDRAGFYSQVDAGVGFGKAKEKQVQGNITQVTQESDVSDFTALIRPGFYFKATKNIILEASFGGFSFSSTTLKPKNDVSTTSNEFGITLTSAIGLGFRVVF